MANGIVLVDDDAFIQKLAKNILEKNNIDVVTLDSGKELLEYLKIGTPELVLLDIKMPELDGFQTIEKLREWERVSAERRYLSYFLLRRMISSRRPAVLRWVSQTISESLLILMFWSGGWIMSSGERTSFRDSMQIP